VDLVFVGDAIESSGLAPVLEELLGRIDVPIRRGPILAVLDPRVVLEPEPDAPPALARIWIELGGARTTVYLVDGEWERILVRHIPSDGPALDEVGREQIAHIVHAAVEALLDGARIGLTQDQARAELGVAPRVTPPEPEPEPTPQAPVAPSELAADFAIGYAPQLFADGPTLRHAVLALVSMLVGRGSPRLAIALGVDFWPTTGHEGGGVRLDLRSLLVRFEAGVDIDLTEETSLRATAGLTIDLTAVEPRTVPGSDVAVASPWDAVGPLASVRVAAHQRLYEWVGLSGGLLFDVDLLDTRYVVRASMRDQTVVDPWPVRPALFVAVEGRLR
jgi:hypothetical protein